ncbi:MAG TPA: hypothetical protein VGM92_02920 [Candidatus Kapabacteria bacterium]|jgi:uncharacterized protein involved in exopolysaccharide biosynthesis
MEHHIGQPGHPAPDLLIYTARHWRKIVLWGIGGAILLLLFSYTRPRTYVATTTVLPPEKESAGGMLAFLANSVSALDILKGSIGGGNPELDEFKTIIESRTIAEDVAKDSIVAAYYLHRDTSYKGMVDALQGSIRSEALRTGEFTVTVNTSAARFASKSAQDSARRMSAYISNRYVEALDRFNRDRLMTSAKNSRIFVEQEYKGKMVDLDSAYGRLEQFQESHQAISLPDQLSATVAAAAKLTGEKEQLEMERTVAEQEFSPTEPHVKALDAKVQAAQQELNRYDSGGAGEYILALKSAPALTRELAGCLREVKVLEQVTAFLREELEQERISEQRDLPSLQVLDRAPVPNGSASPVRAMYIVIGLILGLAIGFGWVQWKRFTSDVRTHPEAHYRLVNVWRSMRRGNGAQLLDPIPVQASHGAVHTSVTDVKTRV